MIEAFRSALRDDAGATAIEYGLLACFVALLIITAVASIGTSLQQVFTDLLAAF